MAKEKKRGLLSWLGFGRDQGTPQSSEQSPAEENPASSEAGSQVESIPNERSVVEDYPVTDTVHQADTTQLGVEAPLTESLPETGQQAAEEWAPTPHAIAVVKVDAENTLPDPQQNLSDSPNRPQNDSLVKAKLSIHDVESIETRAEPKEFLSNEASSIVEKENLSEISPTTAVESNILAKNSLELESENNALSVVEPTIKPIREGLFSRLKRSLVKTRQNLGSGFIGLFKGKKIDDDLFEELEEQLLIADVGVETTRKIIQNLTIHASRKQLKDAEALYGLLKQEMAEILNKVDEPLDIEQKNPFVILMVGVNGVGKTTTIGKLARQYQSQGKSIMLAAGDTFRAAAVEQLQVWGERNHIPVVAQHTGADSASVIYDAIQAAKARNIDVLIADTAGRLQNKSHLMEELKKITRVMHKLDESAPHEVMLTIDASTGQNAISQTKLFHEAVGLTGIALTKLDGTAKGGVIFSVADQFGIPIRYIGVGEGIEDLRPFKAEDFIEALFAREE